MFHPKFIQVLLGIIILSICITSNAFSHGDHHDPPTRPGSDEPIPDNNPDGGHGHDHDRDHVHSGTCSAHEINYHYNGDGAACWQANQIPITEEHCNVESNRRYTLGIECEPTDAPNPSIPDLASPEGGVNTSIDTDESPENSIESGQGPEVDGRYTGDIRKDAPAEGSQTPETKEPQTKPILPKIRITHIEYYRDHPYVWIVYVKNPRRYFVSTFQTILEIWDPEALASETGTPKFYISLPRNARFTYQGISSRKHDYLNSPSGERANNAFLVAGKKEIQNWNHRERHIRFALIVPHKKRKLYAEGDIFVLRDWKTKGIISRFPEENEEDSVPASPIKPGLKLVTTWGSLKSLK